MQRIILLITLLFTLTNASAGQAAIQKAVENANRSVQDKELDTQRKPVAVLEFFGIKEGMSVLDIFAGGGYYTEILSYLVGEEGRVTLYNNNPWNEFVGKAVAKRLAENRLPNVKTHIASTDHIEELPGQYDAAIFVLGMHDIYYTDEANGWPATDRKQFLEGIYGLIAKGGVLGIIDHNAKAGSDPAVVGKDLHRVDPAIIIKDLEAVGFKLEAQSDVLENSGDDLTKVVFDPDLRWKTDRSVLRFRK